jgi:hypothetical protein
MTNIDILFWVSLVLAVVSFGFFLFLAIHHMRRKPKPAATGGLAGANAELLDLGKVLDSAGSLSDAFAKAGPGPTSAVLCVVFILVALAASGLVTLGDSKDDDDKNGDASQSQSSDTPGTPPNIEQSAATPMRLDLGVDLALTGTGLTVDCGDGTHQIITFDKGQSKLDDSSAAAERMKPVIDSIMANRQKRQLAALLLVSSADATPLSPNLKSAYEDNAGLAKARANWVRDNIEAELSDDDRLGMVPPTIVSINTGLPITRLTSQAQPAVLSRAVAVCALWR